MSDTKKATRYYSSIQENAVAKLLDGQVTSNSGASKFSGGDVIVKAASLLIECKTSIADKSSFSVKKDWIEKNKNERFSQRLNNSCIAFNFGPNQPNYFVIDAELMKYLVYKLTEDNI